MVPWHTYPSRWEQLDDGVAAGVAAGDEKACNVASEATSGGSAVGMNSAGPFETCYGIPDWVCAAACCGRIRVLDRVRYSLQAEWDGSPLHSQGGACVR